MMSSGMSNKWKKTNKQRVLLTGAALAVLLQAGGGMALADTPAGPVSPWESIPVIAPPEQYAPFTVMEGPGPIAFPQAVVVEQDILLVPARALLERLGYKVEWDEQARSVVARKNGGSLTFPLDHNYAAVNGAAQTMPAVSRLVGDMAYIPLRFAAEADNREVVWREYNKTIVVREPDSLLNVRVVAAVDKPFESEQQERLAKAAGALTGLHLKLDAMPLPNYQQKVNLMIAANDMPDMLLIPDPFFLQKTLTSSVFWNLAPLLKDYPHLREAVSELEAEVTLDDGGVYGIPRLQNKADGAFPAIRQDWLDRLGLAMPRTMDELVQVMQAFVVKDPDGNGKLDTLGLTASSSPIGLGDLAWVENVFNSSGGRYVSRSGQIVDTWIEPGTKEALKWLNGIYANGLLSKDFPVANADQARRFAMENKAGVIAMTGQAAEAATMELSSTYKGAVFTPIPYLQAKADGPRVVPASQGHSGVFAIPKALSEAKVRRILAWMEAWLGRSELPAAEREALKFLEPYLGGGGFHSTRTDLEAAWQLREEIGTESLQDPTLGLFTNELSAKLADTNKKLYETKIKIILGALPLDQWDIVVNEVKQNPDYQSVMNQLNEKAAKKAGGAAQ